MKKEEYLKTSFVNQFINEDKERYMVYKANKERGRFYYLNEKIELLELLDKSGFDLEKPGTFLFSELVLEIYENIVSCSTKLDDYKLMLVLKDLNSERSLIYKGISDRLGIKEDALVEYIYDATSNISKECKDTDLRNNMLGSNYQDSKPSVLAYNASKYYEKFKKEGYKKPIMHGLVKKIKKK